jgi:formamidopyrimidine-DNA glycosylase
VRIFKLGRRIALSAAPVPSEYNSSVEVEIVLQEGEQMLEYPEALVLSQQLLNTLQSGKITRVTAAQTPHKLTWYNGDPQKYAEMLCGRSLDGACNHNALVQLQAGPASLVFSDGVNLRFHKKEAARPPKHQLLLEFSDGSALSAVVQMYGGIVCFMNGVYDNKYYRAALEKPSVLSKEFSLQYFLDLAGTPEAAKLSLKALLATEQRVPGLGNGVLQDILFKAGLQPRKKVNTLNDKDKQILYQSIVGTLRAMAESGGRDTEKDLFGQPGRYVTVMSSKSAGKPCPACGSAIKKEAYLGGSVYYCEKCQKP